MTSSSCLWFEQIGLRDTPRVGGKCSSLGEMYNQLTQQGIRVPNGYVLTVNTYQEFIRYNQLGDQIRQELERIDYSNLVSLKRGGLQIRNLILNAKFPPQLETQVLEHYRQLSSQFRKVDGTPHESTDVAVRSSSAAEDTQDSSFAGQYDTFLNVRGDRQLIEAIKGCYASLYNNRAISYRHDINYQNPEQLSIAVVVQKMVRSDCGKSGVMFTLDTESGLDRVIVINASYGLCELIVQGVAIKPDEFILNKERLRQQYPAIIDKRMGSKTRKMVYSDNPAEKTRIVPVSREYQRQFSLDDENILELGRWALIVEQHYNQYYGQHQGYDIEFAYDGLERQMYLVQVRPETIHSQQSESNQSFVEYRFDCSREHRIEQRILTGISVGQQISQGKVRVIMSLEDRGDNQEVYFEEGDILVTTSTDPDWEPLMKKASAIITDCGGRTSHASIVSRELGVTCVVGCGQATSLLRTGQEVTVSCAEGDTGYVYGGQIPYRTTEVDLSQLEIPSNLNLMMNLASPEVAFRYAWLPHRGVGLVREEFIINNFIRAHPLALMAYDQSGERLDSELRTQLSQLMVGYQSGTEYYISKLAFGIARIATAVWPHPAIVRFSDFKSNEYANLLGGQQFEPNEENPMLGWRGCSRYYSPQFKEAFGLECQAVKKVRDTYGLTNVIVMLPFCRTPEECQRVQQTMQNFGLVRGENGLQIYLMCELPSNVILADQFLPLVDGYSIGSNDLTQTTLGVDRDSELLSHLFDENHPAIKTMVSQAIQACKRHGKKIGICGQAPSDSPEFAEFLVSQGIDSISLTPDSIIPILKRGLVKKNE